MYSKKYYVEWVGEKDGKRWTQNTKLENEQRMNQFVLQLAHEETTIKVTTKIITEITFGD